MVAITAVKKTVAPIPAYLVFSPAEHWSRISMSAPEQKIKKRRKLFQFVTKKDLNVEVFLDLSNLQFLWVPLRVSHRGLYHFLFECRY